MLVGDPALRLPTLAVSVAEWSAAMFYKFEFAIGVGLSSLLMLAALRLPLRRTWLAAVVLAALLSVPYFAGVAGFGFLAGAVTVSTTVFVLVRFGLVASTTTVWGHALLRDTCFTADLTRWYAWQGVCTVLVLLTLGVFAFWTNLGGRPLFQEED
jgi:hypothetical protein